MRCFLVQFISVAFAVVTTGFGQDHPAHWWEPVPADEQQFWEIVPQEATPGELVLSKRNELGIFSNFANTPFYFHGRRYESVEGFWYMLAYPEGPEDPRLQNPNLEWPHTREDVSQMVGFEAKDAGAVAEANMAALGINWVTFEGRRLKYWDQEEGPHYELIRQVLNEKVRQQPRVRELLLSTGDLRLIPDNYDSLRDLLAWRYFDIHREIRDAYRSGSEPPPSNRYPKHWWLPVAGAQAQEGEVLPQAAGPSELILSNRNELGIFSNFEPTTTPGQGAPYELIVTAMRAKLEQNPSVVRLLLSTGDLVLRPDHHLEPNTPPAGRYCEIWMAIRSELKALNPQTPRLVRTDGSLGEF